MDKNRSEKPALANIDTNTRIPKSFIGGNPENARTRKPVPTTNVLKRIGVPLS